MTLTNARAAIETAIKDSVASTVTKNSSLQKVDVIFDNVPLVNINQNSKYVAVSIDFNQSTVQPMGAAVDYYEARVTCGIFTPLDTGSADANTIAEGVIDGLISVNASTYVDTYSNKPKVSKIEGPTSVIEDRASHFLSVITCTFTANA